VLLAQQQPTFRAATDVVVIDAQVVAKDSTPVAGLKADQFEVFIDGKKRPILSVDFVGTAGAPSVAGGSNSPAPTSSAASPSATEPRVFILGVDQTSFPVTAQESAREAARRVLEGVAPQDYLGLITFPDGVVISPTRDRAPLTEAVARIAGARPGSFTSRFHLSASEASLLKMHDTETFGEVYKRECPQFPVPDPYCRQELLQDAARVTDALEQQGMLTINGLHGALDMIASLPGRKTFIVVSAGLPMSNRTMGRPNLGAETDRIARRAASANVNLYVLYMNVHFMQFFSPAYGKINRTIYDDVTFFGYGLEKFADSAGGSFFQVDVDSDPFVNRVLRETSARYVLTVATEPVDRDGKEHIIRVTTKARGATIRHRKVLIVPARGGRLLDVF
jgi:VWFA-related protein